MDSKEFQRQFTECCFESFDTIMKKLKGYEKETTGEKQREPSTSSKAVGYATGVAACKYLY